MILSCFKTIENALARMMIARVGRLDWDNKNFIPNSVYRFVWFFSKYNISIYEMIKC
jgi:hypothetical protein